MLRPFFHAQTIFGLAVLRGRRKGFCTLPKMCKTWGFCNRFKNVGRRRGIWGRFAKMHVTFSWQAQYFRQVEWKNRKTHWYMAVSSPLNFPFLKGVSQNCFVFDVVWCCEPPKLKKSRRLAPFWMFSTSKIADVSQNSFVFNLAHRQIAR